MNVAVCAYVYVYVYIFFFSLCPVGMYLQLDIIGHNTYTQTRAGKGMHSRIILLAVFGNVLAISMMPV